MCASSHTTKSQRQSGACKLFLQHGVTRQLVQAGDGEVGLQEPVAGPRRGQLVAGEDLEAEVEAPVQLVLPLLGQAAGTDHQTALQIAARDQLLHQQAGHDRLAGSRIVGEQEPQRLPRQHRLVDRGDLMRQRLHLRGVDRQCPVEQMGEVDAQRLRHQPKEIAVAVEAPRPSLLDDLQPRFVVAVEDLTAQLATGRPVDEFHGVRADPSRADHRHHRIGHDAAHCGRRLQILKFHGWSP